MSKWVFWNSVVLLTQSWGIKEDWKTETCSLKNFFVAEDWSCPAVLYLFCIFTFIFRFTQQNQFCQPVISHKPSWMVVSYVSCVIKAELTCHHDFHFINPSKINWALRGGMLEMPICVTTTSPYVWLSYCKDNCPPILDPVLLVQHGQREDVVVVVWIRPVWWLRSPSCHH